MYFVSKIVFTMMFWVIVARWSYAEISKISPSLRGAVDTVLEVATIPTHDQWDMELIKDKIQEIAADLKVQDAFAGNGEE